MRGKQFLATYHGPQTIRVGRITLSPGVPTWVSRSEGNALVQRYHHLVELQGRAGNPRHKGKFVPEGNTTPEPVAIPAPTAPVERAADEHLGSDAEVFDESLLEPTESFEPAVEPAEVEADEEFSLDDEDEESIDDIVARLAPSLSAEDADRVGDLLADPDVSVDDLTMFKGIGKATAQKLIEATRG